jgi:hypothetical protein
MDWTAAVSREFETTERFKRNWGRITGSAADVCSDPNFALWSGGYGFRRIADVCHGDLEIPYPTLTAVQLSGKNSA